MNEAAVGLKEHFDSLITEIDKRYDQRFRDQDKAVAIALEAIKTGTASVDRVQNLVWRIVAVISSLSAIYFATKR